MDKPRFRLFSLMIRRCKQLTMEIAPTRLASLLTPCERKRDEGVYYCICLVDIYNCKRVMIKAESQYKTFLLQRKRDDNWLLSILKQKSHFQFGFIRCL